MVSNMRRSCFKKILSTVLPAILALVLLAQPMIVTAQGAISLANHAPGAPYGLLTNQSEHPMNIEGAPLFD